MNFYGSIEKMTQAESFLKRLRWTHSIGETYQGSLLSILLDESALEQLAGARSIRADEVIGTPRLTVGKHERTTGN